MSCPLAHERSGFPCDLLRHNRLRLFQWNPSLAVAAVTEIEAAVGTFFADNVNVSCFAPHVGDLDDTDESLGIYEPDCIFVTLLDA